MAAAWVIEAVDVLEQAIVRHWFKSNGERRLHLPTRFPRPAPDQLGLDGLEECLDGGVVIAIALAAHRYLEAVFAQDLLVVVGAVLAAAVAVEDAAARRGSQGDGHLQRPDRQVALHAVADGPADDAPRRAANAGPGSQPDTTQSTGKQSPGLFSCPSHTSRVQM